MRRLFPLFSAVLLLAATAVAQDTNAAFMKLITHARFIYVTTSSGDPLDARGVGYDRQVAAQLQNELMKWKRYTVVYRPSDADIILCVRGGAVAKGFGGVVLHGPGSPDPRRRSP